MRQCHQSWEIRGQIKYRKWRLSSMSALFPFVAGESKVIWKRKRIILLLLDLKKNRLAFCSKTNQKKTNRRRFVQGCLTLSEMPPGPSTFLKLKTKQLLSVKGGLSGRFLIKVQRKDNQTVLLFAFVSIHSQLSHYLQVTVIISCVEIALNRASLRCAHTCVDALGRSAPNEHHTPVIKHVRVHGSCSCWTQMLESLG